MRSEEEKKEQKRKAQKKYYEKNKEYYRKQSLEESKRVRKERNLYKEIIKEAREYITSYESISIMQGLMNEYSNYDLDVKTMNEMIRRYMIVHDELLEILDKEKQ